MTRNEKKELYDKLCMELTNFENSENSEEVHMGFLQEFYFLLIQFKNHLEELMCEEDEG